MKRILAGALPLLAAALVYAGDLPIGAKIGTLNVIDLKGKPVQFSPTAQANLVIFVSTKCPVSNAYNERMKALYNDYSARGVHFLFVNANQNEPASEVEDHARTVGFSFPVYKDVNNVIADQFGAQFTPETFVFDNTGTLRYHGHIDDSQNPARITSQTLRQALDAVLAGKAVVRAETKAFGCTIKRVRRTS